MSLPWKSESERVLVLLKEPDWMALLISSLMRSGAIRITVELESCDVTGGGGGGSAALGATSPAAYLVSWSVTSVRSDRDVSTSGSCLMDRALSCSASTKTRGDSLPVKPGTSSSHRAEKKRLWKHVFAETTHIFSHMRFKL